MDSAVDINELKDLYREHIAWLQQRYDESLVANGYSGLVIHSGAPRPRSIFDDQYWPLRVTPFFQHWLPLITANSALVIEPGKKPSLLWNRALGFWEGPPEPETDHFWESFDVQELDVEGDVGKHVPHGEKYAFIGEDEADGLEWGFEKKQVLPQDLLLSLDRIRTVKSPYELLCLREANRRACVGHQKVMECFQGDDLSELQLHLAFLEATNQDDPETPYKNIVALGEHAATLHHVSYSRRQEGAQSLLLDAGSRYQGYESDITRTGVKGSGAAASVFGNLIQRMEELQLETCSRVKVGLNYENLHNESHELLAPILRDLGIAKASDDELVGSKVTRTFLPHGLGHSLGLQTHDVGCARIDPEPQNPFLRNTSDIESGQCFTIEPGCYFIRSLLDDLKSRPEGKVVDWNLVDELVKFGGVRIEDDLAVVDGGFENYTRDYMDG